MAKALVGRPRGENTENANRRRKQLMDAAIESISEHGLSATTLATVAKASGLSQGTTVFYFRSKESLLLETFRYRIEESRVFWMNALSSAGSDPMDQIMALVFATIDPRVMTPQNLIFWNSLWNEASRNFNLAEMSERFEAERLGVLLSLCEDAREQIPGPIWTPKTVAHALETMTEGIWARVYYSPNFISINDAKVALGALLSTIFPSRSEEIMKQASDSPDI
ncbi:MAG: TetR/AcrR family bet gene transcriptional repressor [Gammaproteobacteria bacterium]|jgi:TetR/AcrR family transcriptional repressor of bet genes